MSWTPTEFHVRKRAYNIWLSTGRSDEKANWKQAEDELRWLTSLVDIIGVHIVDGLEVVESVENLEVVEGTEYGGLSSPRENTSTFNDSEVITRPEFDLAKYLASNDRYNHNYCYKSDNEDNGDDYISDNDSESSNTDVVSKEPKDNSKYVHKPFPASFLSVK